MRLVPLTHTASAEKIVQAVTVESGDKYPAAMPTTTSPAITSRGTSAESELLATLRSCARGVRNTGDLDILRAILILLL